MAVSKIQQSNTTNRTAHMPTPSTHAAGAPEAAPEACASRPSLSLMGGGGRALPEMGKRRVHAAEPTPKANRKPHPMHLFEYPTQAGCWSELGARDLGTTPLGPPHRPLGPAVGRPHPTCMPAVHACAQGGRASRSNCAPAAVRQRATHAWRLRGRRARMRATRGARCPSGWRRWW
eukprot:6773463-Prymnesium_polylepis.2